MPVNNLLTWYKTCLVIMCCKTQDIHQHVQQEVLVKENEEDKEDFSTIDIHLV